MANKTRITPVRSKPKSRTYAPAKLRAVSNRGLTGLGPMISAEQWDMPAGYKDDGTTLATLREIVDPAIPTLSLPDLPDEKRQDLVLQRLERRPTFNLNLIEGGAVDKARALQEVKAQTPAGKVIQEIEQRVIQNMLEKAKLQKTPKALRKNNLVF